MASGRDYNLHLGHASEIPKVAVTSVLWSLSSVIEGGGGGSAGLFSVPPSHGWSRVMVTVGGNPALLALKAWRSKAFLAPGKGREGGRKRLDAER